MRIAQLHTPCLCRLKCCFSPYKDLLKLLLVEQGVDPELEVICAWHRGDTEPEVRVFHQCQHESGVTRQPSQLADKISKVRNH